MARNHIRDYYFRVLCLGLFVLCFFVLFDVQACCDDRYDASAFDICQHACEQERRDTYDH